MGDLYDIICGNIKELRLKGVIACLRWAYDSDFMPNTLDTWFKDWSLKGLTAVCKAMKGGIMISFDPLKTNYRLEKQDYYRHLQMWRYVDKKVKQVTGVNVCLIGMLKKIIELR